MARGRMGRGHHVHRPQLPRAPGAGTVVDSIGGITSSRCTNEEVFAVQKMVRAAFGNNNVDTCARVCHSPTGYGLKQDVRDVGRHAGLPIGRPGRRHPAHRREPDRCASGVRLTHEAATAPGGAARGRRPPPDRPRANAARRGRAPPPAAAGHERRVGERAGARRGDRRTRRPGVRRRTVRTSISSAGRPSSPGPEHSPEQTEQYTGVPAAEVRRVGPPLRRSPERRHLLRARGHRAQPGLDDGHGHGEPRDGDGQHRTRRRRGEPAARPEQRAGFVRHGVVPARALRVPLRLRRPTRELFEERCGVRPSINEPGLRIPNMYTEALGGTFKGLFVPGRGPRAVRSEHRACHRRARSDGTASSCRTCS